MIRKAIHYRGFSGKALLKSTHKCVNSWRKIPPDYEIMEWNKSNFDVNMEPYTSVADAAKKYAFVSDFARFWILHQEGGVYFDTDVEVIRPMDDILHAEAFMGMGNQESAAPRLGLAVEAEHPLYRWYLDYFSDKHFTPQQPSMIPVLREKLLELGWQQELRIQSMEGITIYPPDYFCPQTMMGSPICLTENTRSIHHFDCTWLPSTTRFRLKLISRLPQFIRKHLRRS